MINYELPKEVRKYVLQLQADMKIKTGNGKFSQQQTLNYIVKKFFELNAKSSVIDAEEKPILEKWY